MDLNSLGCVPDSEDQDMEQEHEARRRNVEIQLRKWQESTEFEDKFDALFAKVLRWVFYAI